MLAKQGHTQRRSSAHSKYFASLSGEPRLLGNVFALRVEENIETFRHLLLVWRQRIEDLLGGWLSDEYNVAREALLQSVLVFPAIPQHEHPLERAPWTQSGSHSERDVSIKRAQPTAEKIICEGQWRHSRLPNAKYQNAVLAQPRVLVCVAAAVAVR